MALNQEDLVRSIGGVIKDETKKINERMDAFENRLTVIEGGKSGDDAGRDAQRAALYAAAGSAIDANGAKPGEFRLYKPLDVHGDDREMVRFIGISLRATLRANMERKPMEYAAKLARDYFKAPDVADHLDEYTRALTGATSSDGGALIPIDYIPRLIELLYAKVIASALGAKKVPFANGRARIPKMTAGSTAYWSAEGATIQQSQPSFGFVELVAKDLTALVPISNDLLYDTGFSANEFVVNDLIRRIALALDLAVFYGTGKNNQPLGLDNAPDLTKTASNTGAKSAHDDIEGMLGRYYSANPLDEKTGWAMHPTLENWLKLVTSSTGQFIFRDEMTQGMFMGRPYKTSTQIKVTSGKHELWLGDWIEVDIGEANALKIDSSQEASFGSGSGTVSAFANNLTVIRAIQRTDVAVERDVVFQKLTGIDLTSSGWSWN